MLRIYPRLKLDITWPDLAVAATALAFRRDHAQWTRRAEQAWGSGDDVFACLCVRTGWDLLLGALDLPRGSEVLLSAITISHMAEIIRAHGLVPVPVDIDPDTLEPKLSEMNRLVTPRTKILLVAHLFGARIDITPLSDFAARHDLLLVEDCAQAFTGSRDCIDNRAAVSMISFGPIKTATALGGGILIVRRPDLLQKMRAAEAALPLFPTGEFAQRVLKFSFLKFLSIPIVFGIFCRIMKALGRDVEAMLGGSGRAFPPGELLRHIRHRAPAPMMKLLTRRLKKYDGSVVRERAKVGRALMQQLQESPTLRIPGRRAGEHTFWVFPVSAKAPADLARHLRTQGFDCTVGASAMRVIEGDSHEQCPGASQVLEGILYLPVQTGLGRREVERLAKGCTPEYPIRNGRFLSGHYIFVRAAGVYTDNEILAMIGHSAYAPIPSLSAGRFSSHVFLTEDGEWIHLIDSRYDLWLERDQVIKRMCLAIPRATIFTFSLGDSRRDFDFQYYENGRLARSIEVTDSDYNPATRFVTESTGEPLAGERNLQDLAGLDEERYMVSLAESLGIRFDHRPESIRCYAGSPRRETS